MMSACGSSPRVRGNSCRRIRRRSSAGSSPRVRGKLLRGDRRGGAGRLIPARAGKTCRRPASRGSGWAHPRACGENAPPFPPASSALGSSPRVRGKPGAPRAPRAMGRLIPTRAGKTARSTSSRSRPWAHPRACGENLVAHGYSRGGAGSSPRVRGKHRRRPPRSAVGAAHPRACGENADLVTPTGREKGSSPRVRGKRLRARHADPLRGLIPARAGKTRNGSGLGCDPWAHPRACGENVERLGGSFETLGSSPRVRGKHHGADRRRPRRGLIPARAGKTMDACSRALLSSAHPRACGENFDNVGKDIPFMGSSPRVRGKQPRPGPTRRPPRLIPARAGKTDRRRGLA